MRWPPEPLAFTITSHAHLPGARLSLAFSFGNLPFDSAEAAETEARRIASNRRFTIERKVYRALPSYRGAPTCSN